MVTKRDKGQTVNWRETLFFGMSHKLTNEQERYLDSIQTNLLTISNSKAGTGKTTLAVGMAKLLGKPLLYVFNPTEERKMGFRKGSQEDKEMAYLQPLKDALITIGDNPSQVILTEEDLVAQKYGTNNRWVEARSHIFARGTNIVGRTVILDEVQNWTTHDIKKVLTRIHDDCTVIAIGHSGQIDLDKPHDSGFLRMIDHFRDKDYCGLANLTVNFRGVLSRDADDLF